MNTKSKSFLSAISAFAFWSTLGVYFNVVDLPVSVSVVFGSLIGLNIIFFYVYFVAKVKLRLHFSPWLLFLFLIAAIKGVIWFKALTLIPVAQASFIHNLAPVITVLLAPLLINEKPHLNHIVAILTGLLGLYVMLQIENFMQFLQAGVLFSLGAALFSALQDIAQRKLSHTVTGLEQALVFILGQALGSVFFLMPHSQFALNWIDLGAIIYFGVVGTALPIILLSSAFKALRSFEVATIGYVEPVLGSLWAIVFLHQPIVPSTLIGGALIVFSGLTAVRNGES
ncbi:MAG: DMT family transporter [Patescibacteria group bacterium]|mgnify:CR=1 FL=1